MLYLDFNEPSGATAFDLSGNGNDGQLVGATRVAQGISGGGVSLDGDDDFIEVPDDPTLDMTGEVTITAWVRPSALGGYRIIADKTDQGQPTNYYFALLGAEVDFGFFTGGWFEQTSIGAGLLTDVWYHVAVVFDDAANEVRMYRDGDEILSTVETGSLAVNDLPLRLGASGFANEFFDGLFDEVRIFNRALSQGEIAAIVSADLAQGAGSSSTGLPEPIDPRSSALHWALYE